MGKLYYRRKKMIEGKIVQIVPNGGYQGRNGYIYTFQMSIQNENGVFTGQIGSKTENYPLTVGQPILVEMTTNQYGNKFTRINPKYANRQPRQPQQSYQQPQQGYPRLHQSPQGPQLPAQATISSDDTQVHIIRQSLLNRAVELYIACMDGPPLWPIPPVDIKLITELADKFMPYIKNGLPPTKNPAEQFEKEYNIPPEQDTPPENTPGQEEIPY